MMHQTSWILGVASFASILRETNEYDINALALVKHTCPFIRPNTDMIVDGGIVMM